MSPSIEFSDELVKGQVAGNQSFADIIRRHAGYAYVSSAAEAVLTTGFRAYCFVYAWGPVSGVHHDRFAAQQYFYTLKKLGQPGQVYNGTWVGGVIEVPVVRKREFLKSKVRA